MDRSAQPRTNGVRVTTWGEGPLLLVCLPGLGGGSHFFRPIGCALAGRWRTLAVDYPGCGPSPSIGELSFEGLAGTILDVVAMEMPRILCLLGHSMGTIVGLEAIRRAPQLASAFVAVGGLPEPLPDARSRLRARAIAIRAHGMAGLAESVIASNLAERTRRERPELAALFGRTIELLPADGYAATAEALAAWTARPLPELRQVRCLAVTGDEDRYAPPAAVEAFARQLPEGTGVEVISDCGHLPFFEQPAAFTAVLDRFLAALPAHAG